MKTVDVGGLPVGDDHPPRIVGVLNVSRESPYDPSVFDDPAEAAAYVDDALIDQGADVVDVGLESANKRFDVLSAEQELDRLDVAVETLDRVEGDAVFSIETRYAAVADEALSRGFDAINDVCGFADPEMPAVAEAHDVAVVKMASPPDLDRPGAVDDVDWAAERSPDWAANASFVDKVYASLERGGLTGKTIVDPAFGGWSETKTLADDRQTFERLREFRALGRPVLVSINRKNFLKDVVDRSTEDALPASLGATSLAVDRGAHVIRTHDVAATRDAALIGHAFDRDRVRTEHVEELAVTNARELARHLERVGGDPATARAGVDRAVAVTDLGPEETDSLQAVAADCGLVVAGGDRSILAGSAGEFAALASELEGETRRLEGVAGALDRLIPMEKTYTGWG
ncbi:MAG: dihydropteroate synthase [Halanaeroarchaeum sp.]